MQEIRFDILFLFIFFALSNYLGQANQNLPINYIQERILYIIVHNQSSTNGTVFEGLSGLLLLFF